MRAMELPALLGQGVLVNWVDVPPDLEVAFNDWYTHEHVPERVGIPGFRRGRRFVRTGPPPHDEGKYLTIYETEDLDVLQSAPYMERLNDPTPETTRMVASLTYFSRTACRVTASAGRGTAGHVATIELGPSAGGADRVRDWLTGAFAQLRTFLDVVAIHLFEPDLGVTSAKDQTAEGKQTGETPPVRWIVLAELSDRSRADRVHEVLCGPEGLPQIGIEDPVFATFETMMALVSLE